MDNNTVFIKTKEGEEAVRQRTRLVQRNLRNILIMVDGHAAVAELSRRFGDANATQAALTELAANGFIAEVTSGSATVLPSGSSMVEETEDLPVLTTTIASLPIERPIPVQETSPLPVEQAPLVEETSPPSVEQPIPQEIIPLPAEQPIPVQEYAPLPEEHPFPSQDHPPLPPGFDDNPPAFHEYESVQPAFNATEAWKASPPKPVAPGWLDKLKTLLSARKEKLAAKSKASVHEEAQKIGPIELEPIRRKSAFPISWPLLALFAVAGLTVLLILSALLFPYSRYLPDVEKKAATLLKEPVKIGDIGFSLLPRPHFFLRDIKVGPEGHLTVAAAKAVPEYLSLLGDTTIVSELILEKPGVKSPGLGRLAQAGAGKGLEIRHISLHNLSLLVGDSILEGMSGEVMMASGSPEKIILVNADGTLKVEMTPKQDGYQIAANGRNWTAPFNPNLIFQGLDIQGELTSSRLALTKIDGKAYEGLVEGKALLEWTENNAMLSGELTITRSNAARLLAALGSELAAEGELTARANLQAKADKLDKLAAALRAEGTFEIKRGEAKGFDLGEAVRNTGRTPTRGGVTKFEQLTGTYLFDPQGRRLDNLRLGSGLFKAGGNLGIARNAQLSGAVEVELKSSAATLRIPLTISGTTKEPLLIPGRGK